MTTINPLNPSPDLAEWVRSLPAEVVTSTFNTRALQDACRNADATLAEQIVQALEARPWERGIAVVCNGVPEVRTFKSWVEWCKAYPDQGGLHREPAWLFRKVTAELIGEHSIKAAMLLAQNMSKGELQAYCRDTPKQAGFISIAKGNQLSHGPDWAAVVNLLEELSRKKPGEGTARATSGKFTVSDDTSPTVATPSSKPASTSKEGLRRRLAKQAADDTVLPLHRNAAMDGLQVLDRGGTYRAACDAAGIEAKNHSKIIYVRKDLTVTADRIVELLGKEHTAELITLLQERINDE